MAKGRLTMNHPFTLFVAFRCCSKEIESHRLTHHRQNFGSLFLFFRIFLYGFRQVRVTIFIFETPPKIIVTAIHRACSAFAGDVLMPVGGFDDFTAEFALNSVFDDFSHIATPCIRLCTAQHFLLFCRSFDHIIPLR